MSVYSWELDPDAVSMRSIHLMDAASVGSLDMEMDEAVRQSILSVLSSPEQMAALSREDRQRIQQQARGLLNDEAGPQLQDAVSSQVSSSETDEIEQDERLVQTMQMLFEELGSTIMNEIPTFALFDIIRAVAKLSGGAGDAQSPEEEERAATLQLLKCSSAGNILQRLEVWPMCRQQLNACAASTEYEPLFVHAMHELVDRNGGDQSQAMADKYKMGLCDVCCSPANTLLWCQGCCETSVCVSCLHQWLVSRLADIHVELTCPGCDSTFAPDELRHLLSEAEFRRREQLVARHHCRSRGERDCPKCSCMARRPAKNRRMRLGGLSKKKAKEQGGVVVTCAECSFVWCFDCHSPAHTGMSCRKFLSGAQQLESWAKQVNDGGLRRARRCPRCRAMIEKNAGCNHMSCGNCESEFCYLCGKNWRVKQARVPYLRWSIFGSHSDRLSIFGCRQSFMPDRPGLRRFIRVTLFALRACGLLLCGSLAVAIALALVGLAIPLSPVLIPVIVVLAKKGRLSFLVYRW